jgi:hypothetical protein
VRSSFSRLLLSLFLLAGFEPASTRAATVDGAFAVRGAGVIDCKTFLAEREKRSRAYLMMGGWIDGYLTGINQYAPDTYDATSFESTELFAQIIADHCKTHPYDRLFEVMNSIIRQKWQNRTVERSPFVTVTVGGRSTQLYRTTVVRVQQRLAKKGFLRSQPSGDFDDATVRAIAAFQKTLAGYKPTGFPDQATLFMLFAK